eukprot:CAMPEP_0184688068 /NCGR_PEP_ID=MMETSP0312-20130426/28435_1 /TAXON_ID=31354 /ORGANISM="Compsopogon coeruleus, Strain SAG 36.94" /LENGTH=383 /DNA_ID=CAMNT_0027144805 /DNA_START=241 /DNA_END=1392 /DNA_ORIENTATION=+
MRSEEIIRKLREMNVLDVPLAISGKPATVVSSGGQSKWASISRKGLVAEAKKRGIRANMKSDEIRRALEENTCSDPRVDSGEKFPQRAALVQSNSDRLEAPKPLEGQSDVSDQEARIITRGHVSTSISSTKQPCTIDSATSRIPLGPEGLPLEKNTSTDPKVGCTESDGSGHSMGTTSANPNLHESKESLETPRKTIFTKECGNVRDLPVTPVPLDVLVRRVHNLAESCRQRDYSDRKGRDLGSHPNTVRRHLSCAHSNTNSGDSVFPSARGKSKITSIRSSVSRLTPSRLRFADKEIRDSISGIPAKLPRVALLAQMDQKSLTPPPSDRQLMAAKRRHERVKFNLQESLARPVTWHMKLGKTTPKKTMDPRHGEGTLAIAQN